MIQTRQNQHGNWWCNTTIDGYDYSFEGATIEDAQEQMIELINNRGYHPLLFKWEDPTYYKREPKQEKPQIGYARSRIDDNPIG